MSRKSKYSYEEKLQACEDYFSERRSGSQIATDLGLKHGFKYTKHKDLMHYYQSLKILLTLLNLKLKLYIEIISQQQTSKNIIWRVTDVLGCISDAEIPCFNIFSGHKKRYGN